MPSSWQPRSSNTISPSTRCWSSPHFHSEKFVRNRDAVGWISKWAVELMGYDVRFVPRTAIKSQALADFIAEWTEVQAPTPEISHEYWTLYFDGSVMGPGAGAGVVLVSQKGASSNTQSASTSQCPTTSQSMRHSSAASA